MEPAIRHSITFRMTVAVSVFLLIAQIVLAALAFYCFKREIKNTISTEQFTLLSVLAQNIDQKLSASQGMVVASAQLVTPELVANAEAAQRYLDGRVEALNLFDNGLFLFSADGKILAETPYLPNRRGRDISFRQYYQATIASGKALISDPYPSTHNPGVPAVMFTAPVRDQEGRLIAIFGGSLNLLADNFLGELSRTTIAKAGYLYVVTRDRMLIMHPDKSRIMHSGSDPGVNHLLDRAINGFEGTEENVNSRELNSLASFKHLQSADWIMGANYPLSEAYEPIFLFQKYFFLLILIGAGISILVVRWLMARFTQPLVEFARHVKDLSAKQGTDRLFLLASKDEVGILAQTFNAMIQDEDKKSAELLHASTHDALTGLYNRAYFDSELERLSRGRQTPISVVVADIDHLKECNDTQGHAAGDLLIKRTAQVLLESFRAEDIVARIGGDEFAVLLPGVNTAAVTLTLERIRSFEATAKMECPLSISLGMATCVRADGLLEAFRGADQAMYLDKASRKARIFAD